MRDHSGNLRQFACFANDSSRPVKIVIGLYGRLGGTSGEFTVEWESTSDGCYTPRLKVWNDGWSALQHFQDMLEVLAAHDSEDLSPEKFMVLLQGLGIANHTRRDAHGTSPT